MNVEEIEEHGLVLAIQAAHMHSINCKEASAAASAIVSLIKMYFLTFSVKRNLLYHLRFSFIFSSNFTFLTYSSPLFYISIYTTSLLFSTSLQ